MILKDHDSLISSENIYAIQLVNVSVCPDFMQCNRSADFKIYVCES